jgi:hypothetical protein
LFDWSIVRRARDPDALVTMESPFTRVQFAGGGHLIQLAGEVVEQVEQQIFVESVITKMMRI